MSRFSLIITTTLLTNAIPILAFTGHITRRPPHILRRTAATSAARGEHQSATTFQSPKSRVYIEDTDAYGVLYNSNYVRAYEQALLRHAPLGFVTEMESIPRGTQWMLSQITNQKFRSSPEMGQEYSVRGIQNERNHGRGGVESWEMELVTDADSTATVIVHNSARVTVTCVATPETQTIPSEDCNFYERRYIPYHDEFDLRQNHNDTLNSGGEYYIPLRNAMNFFERSRSDFLGGPKHLRKTQVDHDLIWVVTGVDNGALLVGDCLGNNNLPNLASTPATGEVVVRTKFETKRRGMCVECQHVLFLSDGHNGNRPCAQATVTIMALKGSTRRPTSDLPQWVLERLTF